jgi:hypothetical protein
MNRIAATLLTIAAASLPAAAPALADRHADGPIDAPRQVDSLHTEFTLPGGPWRQVVESPAGTPSGTYVYTATLPGGGQCDLSLTVRAGAKRRRPLVARRTIALQPPGEVLRFDHQGRHGGVRWWSGTVRGSSNVASAWALQRMPGPLRSEQRAWLLYRIDVGQQSLPADELACRGRARRTGARAVRAVARTLKVADGPAVATPPLFVPGAPSQPQLSTK